MATKENTSASIANDGFSKIETRSDLRFFLEKLIDEDNGTRISAEAAWAKLDNYTKSLKSERLSCARIRRKVYA